ncbi:undecaprenyldiphospho-muramoylpentapeptide beta-N-acetylglucosaminyltransferase [Candidatus Methylomirabilis sp.]|uniref:undecaprenyldiphospho-muramoylpentapeptide beta-N-acetylglucosaminyltransferase n=1 Tax=Candidatus Methylomirabilis sp. TaxID=2032687 RepID=UPI0030765558
MKAIIAGGGTGGHLFPAIALAEELRSRWADLPLLFVGVEGGVEASLLATRGWDFEGIKASGLQGKRFLSRMRSLSLIPLGLIRSLSILRRFRPDVVVGFGGYASVAMVLSGVLARVPTVIHEQNALPGLANRWLGRVVDHVAVAFDEAADFFPKRKVRVTGNPVRAELFGISGAEAVTRLDLDPDRLTILIFGGSQGAHRLNQAVMEALPTLADWRERIQFIHATGPRDLASVRQGYDAGGYRAVVEPFFQAMAMAYAAADLCFCRAGAGTVAELCALGKPSVLIPFPFAANDHQRYNAEALVASGGARMVLDRELNGATVAEIIRTFLRNREGLEAMARRAKTLAKPDAAIRLADLVTRTASRGSRAKLRLLGPDLQSGTRNCGHV